MSCRTNHKLTEGDRYQQLNAKKTLRITASVLVIALVGYFYSMEVARNWSAIGNFKVAVNVYFLFISLCLCLLSYLLETFIWKVSIDRHLGRPALNLFQSIAVVNASGLLKYLPGRIWTYTAQLVWLKKYGISKPVILYVNLICLVGAMIVSMYLGLIYLILYSKLASLKIFVLCALALMLLNAIYIRWNSLLVNKLIGIAGRLLKKEIQPLRNPGSLFILIQFVYAGSWSLAGMGGYFLARGIGLPFPSSGIFGLLASMAIAWFAGYVAVIAPGGLGVREGTMLLMLNNIVSVQTALILPIASRFMYLIAEALLGIAALVCGIKYKVFYSDKRPAE
jgi:uncharacterized membrane protein YbhN (UPF0104 family)